MRHISMYTLFVKRVTVKQIQVVRIGLEPRVLRITSPAMPPPHDFLSVCPYFIDCFLRYPSTRTLLCTPSSCSTPDCLTTIMPSRTPRMTRQVSEMRCDVFSLVPVVQRTDNFIHWISRYAADNMCARISL